jgi:tRNA-splicing ligase RtcB
MDMSRLKQVDAYCWMLPAVASGPRHAITLYGSRELLQCMDDKVLEQITNVAQLPGLVGAAMTMPDAHWGYGFPLAASASTFRAVSAACAQT